MAQSDRSRRMTTEGLILSKSSKSGAWHHRDRNWHEGHGRTGQVAGYHRGNWRGNRIQDAAKIEGFNGCRAIRSSRLQKDKSDSVATALTENIPPGPHPDFLMFLTKEKDGRYVPVTGQVDPALFSVIELKSGGIPEGPEGWAG